MDHDPPCFPPPPPPLILHNHCFQVLLGITVVPREIEDNGYAKFWGVNKVNYGLCENGEFKVKALFATSSSYDHLCETLFELSLKLFHEKPS